MLRFVSRLAGYWLVAAALVVAVLDGARSIAASAMTVTPLGDSWTFLAGLGSEAAAPAGEPFVAPWPLDLALAWIAEAPTAAALALCGFILLAAGRRKRRHILDRGFAA